MELPSHPTGAAAQASLPLGSGAFAQRLIQHQVRRLGRLQAAVLADRDPEPLHQLRVSLRRLRTVLVQFGPALELPRQVTPQRIAVVARRTGLCRDLDVLRMRLEQQLLPRIAPEEQRSFAGVIQRLGRDRAEAFQTLVETLHSSRYLRLLQRLNQWQKRPRFTCLGQLPLLPWLADWQAPFSAGLFLHPGWTVVDPAAAELHALRKRIKAARYSLEILAAWCEPELQAWLEDLRQAQEHLGELHDLQLLQHNLADGLRRSQRCAWPLLRAEIEARQLLHWLRWRELAQRLYSDRHRHAIQRRLGQLGRTAPHPGPAGQQGPEAGLCG
ncbi:MAG: CHAD domain-containing protein [Synechococcus sp.]|nr:CHAD domain-containing protein [Synechococcus sp.]